MFTSAMIKNCMKKVTAVHLHQTIQVDDQVFILNSFLLSFLFYSHPSLLKTAGNHCVLCRSCVGCCDVSC